MTASSAGCTSAASASFTNGAMLSNLDAPTASVTAPPTCTLATGTITVTDPAPGTGILYTIKGPNPIVDPVSNATGVFANLLPGVYDVTYTQGGCTSAALSLTILPAPDQIQLSGTINYYNNSNTPLNNLTVKLNQSGATVHSALTDESGGYLFASVCPGTYDVEITTGKDMGGINSTDAGQVNGWNVSQMNGKYTGIEKVRFLAGDVSGNLFINAIDAATIQEYFVKLAPSNLFDKPWEFWKAGDFLVDTQPQATNVPQIVIAPGSGPVIQNFLGLVSGDFNQSFVPSNLKSTSREIRGASSTLSLINGENIKVVQGMTIDLPVKARSIMQVGAISLILDYPKEKLEVTGVFLQNNIEKPVMYNTINGELRIGWNSLNPLSLEVGETMLTVRLKIISSMVNEEVCHFELANNPLNELADGLFDVIPEASLAMDVLELKKGVTAGIEIPDHSGQLMMTGYPNPFKGIANIEYRIPGNGHVNLEVTSILGNRMILLLNEQQAEGEHFITIDGDVLAPGVYLVTLRFENQNRLLTKTIRIVKK